MAPSTKNSTMQITSRENFKGFEKNNEKKNNFKEKKIGFSSGLLLSNSCAVSMFIINFVSKFICLSLLNFEHLSSFMTFTLHNVSAHLNLKKKSLHF